jgi:hypothetical protein
MSYRSPVSKKQQHTLEIYYYKLVLYTTSGEYKNLSTYHQKKITDEISYMSIVLGIFARLMPQATHERPVYAWPIDITPGEYGEDILYRFSCMKVAAAALGCTATKIAQVCKSFEKRFREEPLDSSTNRNSTGGWAFCYEEHYKPNVTYFNFKTGKYE